MTEIDASTSRMMGEGLIVTNRSGVILSIVRASIVVGLAARGAVIVDAGLDVRTTSGGVTGVDAGEACDGGATIRGVVHDPAGKVPLYDVAVYVPSEPLAPIADGVTCVRRVSMHSRATR